MSGKFKVGGGGPPKKDVEALENEAKPVKTDSVLDFHFEEPEPENRSGNRITAFMLVITAVIGAGVLALPYSMAMLGWVGGMICMLVFSWATLYTSWLLAEVNIVKGRRMRSYTDNVQVVLGPRATIALGWFQQVNLVLTALAYSITSTLSLQTVATILCSATAVEDGSCFNTYWKWAMIFGAVQILMSFLPNLESSWIPSVLGALMSFTYSSIALGRSISEGNTHGTVGGISGISTSEKLFGVFNSLGAILFAYSFSIMLPEIQDTISDTVKGGPIKAMKDTVTVSVSIMTAFYIAVAVSGYMAFGNDVAGMILDSFKHPEWLVITGHICIVVHMVPSYQVWSQPFFFWLETYIRRRFPRRPRMFTGWTFRLWYRPLYVILITFLTICMPFFSYIIGFVGAIGFWPTTVYFPIEMWIRLYNPSPQRKFWLEVLNVSCFIVTMFALVGSVQSIVDGWTTFCFFC